MKGLSHYNVVPILAIVISILCTSTKSTPEWINIKNLVGAFEEKYLQQFSLTFICSMRAFKTASKEIFGFSGAVVALNALDSYLCNSNVSKQETRHKFTVENEPLITFGLGDNIKDLWTIFETTLNNHWNCISSQCFTNNERLVFVAMWPELLNEDEVGDVIENSIRTNPFLRKFRYALGMDKNLFIVFPIYKYPINPTHELMHTYELYYIKDVLMIERVKINILENMQAFKLRRSNFRKVPIISVTQPDERFPSFAKHTNVSGKLALTGGAALDILETMSLKLNFTPWSILGNGWIDSRPDGSLTGMGEQLLNGEADMILSRSEILEYRAEKLSAVHPIHVSRIKVYFKKPIGVSVRDIYFMTFAPELWLAILIMWLAIGATFTLFARCKRKISSINETHGESITWSDVVLWFIGSASMQGWNSAPSETSLRIIFVSGKYATFIMYAIFSSFMISRLSVEKNVINSLEDLKREGFELYAQDVSIYSLAVVKNFTQTSNISSISLNVEAGIEKIINSKAAFLTSYGLFVGIGVDRNSSLCSFNSDVKVEGGRVWSSLYFRKNDPTRTFFDYQFSMWDERGLIRRMQINYNRDTIPMCDGSSKQEVYLISLFDVATAFLIFGAGALISMICLTTELCVYSHKFTSIKDEYENICKVCNK